MITIPFDEVLLFEKPRLFKRGIFIAVIYFLLLIMKECLCFEFNCPYKWMELPFDCSNFVGNQCLVPNNFSDVICKLSINRNSQIRTTELRKTMLNFCNHYNLAKVISENDILRHIEGRNCTDFLRNIECKDYLAETMYKQFIGVISRMDCDEHYSVQWNCTDCLQSYKVWTCSTFFSIYQGDIKIPPCPGICSGVENRCPFFRPDSTTVHAGEPSFLCKALTEVENKNYSNEQCYKACYFTDPKCSLPEIKRDLTSNSSISTNCSSGFICDLRTNVIWLFYVWLIRTFIQNMSIGLT